MIQSLSMKTDKIQLLIGLVLVAVAAYGAYHSVSLSKELENSRLELASSTAQLAVLQAQVLETRSENDSLSTSLEEEKERNDSFAGQIEDMADTVGVLEKIKNTDPELLKKYSKIYFLNENYIPSKLVSVPKEWLFNSAKPQLFHGNVLPYLEDMFEDAQEDGVELRVASAFRSFETQASVKAAHLMTYGSGANQFSADQGYSEHQLGTTVDITLPTLTSLSVDFEKTEAYKWLTDNAYRYGFILSYPRGNTYYQFEPWHWRFVGTALAKYLHKESKNFYDLDQRQIDDYRADFFN